MIFFNWFPAGCWAVCESVLLGCQAGEPDVVLRESMSRLPIPLHQSAETDLGSPGRHGYLPPGTSTVWQCRGNYVPITFCRADVKPTLGRYNRYVGPTSVGCCLLTFCQHSVRLMYWQLIPIFNSLNDICLLWYIYIVFSIYQVFFMMNTFLTRLFLLCHICWRD